MGLEELQCIENWRNDVLELPQEDSSHVSQSNLAFSALGSDPEAFHKVATGSTKSLLQLCESDPVSVKAIDRSGHSLLRVSCQCSISYAII